MINEEWNKTQNDAPFVAFYNMRAVMFGGKWTCDTHVVDTYTDMTNLCVYL